MIIFNNNSIGYVLDTDASKVIEAVRSTGVTITPAMRHYAHYLISNMKNIGTWQNSLAVYGFVGGTASSHKWNWKDLRDVDAAFRLTYTGGVTHSSNGIQFNGSTGYANTFFNPSIQLSSSSTHLYTYIKAVANAATVSPYLSGISDSGNIFGLLNRTQGGFVKGYQSSNSSSTDFYYNTLLGSTPLLKSFSGNLLGGVISSWNNAIKISLDLTGSFGSALPNANIPIGCQINTSSIPQYDLYGNYLLSCVSVGSGLTDAQIIQRDQIINNAQLILNRA